MTSHMKPEDAEEFTQSLGQVLGGSWRQIALARKLGVPKALGLTTEEWVKERLGGYVRLSVDERREAAKELSEEGVSNREIGEVLGASHQTIGRDLTGPNGPSSGEETEDPAAVDAAIGPCGPPPGEEPPADLRRSQPPPIPDCLRRPQENGEGAHPVSQDQADEQVTNAIAEAGEQDRRAKAHRSNLFSHIGKIIYVADIIGSDKNVAHAVQELRDHPGEFERQERYTVGQLTEACELAHAYLLRLADAIRETPTA